MYLRLSRTKWTSPHQLPKSLIHEGLAPLCVPDACCMPFATIFLTHLCTSSRSVLLYRTNFPIKEQSGQVHFNSLNPSFMRDLLHFVCQMRVACLLQQYSLRISSVRYFTKTRTSLSKICVCTSSGRVLLYRTNFPIK